MLTRRGLVVAAVAAWVASGAALAALPSFQIVEVFSSADGAIQFIQLREAAGQNGQHALAGKSLTVTRAGRVRTFTFPADLPHPNTANRAVLLASEGYVAVPFNYPEYHAAMPDYRLPDRFLPAEGGTINFAGADEWTYDALPRDGFSAVFRTGNPVRDNTVQNYGGVGVSLPVVPVTAVEFHHGGLDHYFISDLAPDIDALDSGRIAGWTRTGGAFKVWPISMGFLNDVCRYYIPPEHGNSHFFSASKAECAAVAAQVDTNPNFSGYVLETSDAFAVALPDASGTCPNNWVSVFRLWNNRADSNHRYTKSLATKAQMIASGYVPEGYGPDAVSMCSPL